MKTMTKTWLSCAVLLMAGFAPVATIAETYYLKKADASNTSSFAGGASKGDGSGWQTADGVSGGVYPTEGNVYVVENMGLRTPNVDAAKTFAGDSLTIRTDVSQSSITWGTLTCKHKGGASKPMTIDNLILENGIVPASDTYSSSNKEKTLAGNITINEGFYGFFGNSITSAETDDRRMYLKSDLHGAGTFATVFQSANARVYMAGSAADFTGRVYIGRDDQYASSTGAGKFFVLDGAAWFGDPEEFVADGFVVRNGSTVNIETDVVSTANRGVQILDKAPTISVSEGKALAILAPVVSDFGFTKTGEGTIELAADNSDLSSSASIAVSAGTLKLSHPNAVGSASVSIDASATLEIDSTLGAVVLADVPTGLSNLKVSAASVTDPTHIPVLVLPDGTVFDSTQCELTYALPAAVDVSSLMMMSEAIDGGTCYYLGVPASDLPTIAVEFVKATANSAYYDVTVGYAGECDEPLVVTAYYGTADCGSDAEAWQDHCDFAACEPGTHALTITGLVPENLYYVAFAVHSENGDETIWTTSQLVSTGSIVTSAPADVFEGDQRGVTVTFARAAVVSSTELTIALAYEGAVDSFDATSLANAVTFVAGSSTASVTLHPIDNANVDGERALTVAVVPSSDYVTGELSAVTIALKDDESYEPRECVWTGAVDANWSEGGNWSSGTAPTILDTAVFGAVVGENAQIVVDGDAVAAKVRVVDAAGFSFVTNATGGALAVGALETTAAFTGNLDLKVPLRMFAADGTNRWALAGGTLRIYADLGKIPDALTLLKTGAGRVELRHANPTFSGTWYFQEGTTRSYETAGVHGKTYVGGGEIPARLEQDAKGDFGSSMNPVVYTNGYLAADAADGGRMETATIYAGGEVNWKGNIYCKEQIYAGGTLSGNAQLYLGYGQRTTVRQSDIMACCDCRLRMAGYAYTFDIADGASPVDFLLTRAMLEGGSSQTVTKTGEGTIKSTANCTSLKSKVTINAGKWYVDNDGEYGMGIQTATVAAGALLGGTGHIGMQDVKTYATLTLNSGTEEQYATIAPGTIDNATGAHVYGTLTVAYTNRQNSASLGNYAHLTAGLGAAAYDEALGRRVSPNDKLMVHGTVTIGQNCVLDLASNSAADPTAIRGGTYTVLEAQRINGEFASVILPQGVGWKVSYVTAPSAEEGGDPVVCRIDVTVSKGFLLMIR